VYGLGQPWSTVSGRRPTRFVPSDIRGGFPSTGGTTLGGTSTSSGTLRPLANPCIGGTTTAADSLAPLGNPPAPSAAFGSLPPAGGFSAYETNAAIAQCPRSQPPSRN